MEILEFLIIERIISEIEHDLLKHFRVLPNLVEDRRFTVLENNDIYEVSWVRINDRIKVNTKNEREGNYFKHFLVLSLSECIETIADRS